MNIFVTNTCPVKSAQYLDNKRVVKMILESVQMLCTALAEYDMLDSYEYSTIKSKRVKKIYYLGLNRMYTPTHKNHPCNVWVRQSSSNWQWLFDHGMALCNEYTRRYGKIHKSESILHIIKEFSSKLPQGPLTAFANCAAHNGLGLDFKSIQPTTEAYKQYLTKRWETDKLKPVWS